MWRARNSPSLRQISRDSATCESMNSFADHLKRVGNKFKRPNSLLRTSRNSGPESFTKQLMLPLTSDVLFSSKFSENNIQSGDFNACLSFTLSSLLWFQSFCQSTLSWLLLHNLGYFLPVFSASQYKLKSGDDLPHLWWLDIFQTVALTFLQLNFPSVC